MSAASYPRLFGMKVYKTSFLKLYLPFILSGSTVYFGVASIHTALTNVEYHLSTLWMKTVSLLLKKIDTSSTELTLGCQATPDDKWVNIVNIVEAATKNQVLKNEATDYLKSLESAKN
ncbi:hypothetical protein BDEG_24796 [Batrachochytrium dendrobatidis JEL423]|uniref:Uncharacterized protein n=1 Tax=Batrachochytrium dendrobatidis (strain JEL423) TaxID=403673 RepID=A0A177WN89_BATDL|nr:hypothetical protein BDEG_24796 [Batrachochytrium dendrobatidis JEL423]